ncbi:alpha/beta hydrolase [Actinoplanes sp. NPDC024001]|uniref:alpha/beta fold hydrolase n=1 Tax=Actinoplanes sp. NPDC024001 TaxID=3154598 RepID=UPI0033F1543C
MGTSITLAPAATRPLRRGIHVIDVDGVEQSYHVRGSGADVCVVLPGGPGLSWEYLRMPALEQAMRVVYVEPLGTGRSGRLTGHPHGYDRPAYARVLDRLLDHLGRPRVHLLGHCHGGKVAQYYALRRPDRLATLILYASTPVEGAERAAETRRQVDRFIRRNQWNPELPAVLDAVRALPGIEDDRRLTATVRRALPMLVAHYWARREELSRLRSRLQLAYVGDPGEFDDRAALPGLRVPTLVIAGSYDVLGGLRWGRELHSLIPYARLLVLASSGHFGHIEEPERFTEAVLGFLRSRRLEPRAGSALAA